MYFINPVITDLVQVKVNEALSANQPLTFTKMSIGKGKHVGDLKKVTSMKTHFMDLSVTKELQGDTTKLFSRLSNEEFVEETHITELGIFARVGSTGQEFMFMYTCADQGDIVPPANRGAYTRTYRFETTLRSDGELTINVIGGAFLTPEDLEVHTNDKSNPHSVTKEQIGLVNSTDTVDGLMSKEDKFKLDTMELGANNYTHPATHPASMVTESTSKRFVTDSEKSTWNNKQNALIAGTNISISGNTISSVGGTSSYGLIKPQFWLGKIEQTARFNVEQAVLINHLIHITNSNLSTINNVISNTNLSYDLDMIGISDLNAFKNSLAKHISDRYIALNSAHSSSLRQKINNYIQEVG